MSMYEIISLKTSLYSKDDFDDVNKIELGQSSFDTAVVFYGYLCIGAKDKVYFIDMNNLECREICVQMYFGYNRDV